MENLHAKGPSRDWRRPLFCFESAQQLKGPRREWQCSLPHLATLPTLTRVKLDNSSNRAEGGKGVQQAHPAGQWGSVPKTPPCVYAPASLLSYVGWTYKKKSNG